METYIKVRDALYIKLFWYCKVKSGATNEQNEINWQKITDRRKTHEYYSLMDQFA